MTGARWRTQEAPPDDPRSRALKGYSSLDIYEYEKHLEMEGMLRHVRTKTIREVYDELREMLGEYPDGGEEYFSPSTTTDPKAEWPQGRIVCYSVNGTSEGDYSHVDVHGYSHVDVQGYGSGVSALIPIFTGKTFMGRDASWAFARLLADILEIQ